MLYNFVIFTMNKCEENINEWIVHHLLIGFERIYIYDDNSIIPIKDTISELPDDFKNKVTIYRLDNEYEVNKNNTNADISELIYYDKDLYDKYKNFKQLYFYNYFLKYHKNICNWGLFCDIDEYVFIKDYDTIQDLFIFLDSKNITNNYDIIYLRWIMYGTSFYVDNPPGLIIDNFRCHENKYYGCGKSILKMKNIEYVDCVHKILKTNDNTYDVYLENDNKELYNLPIHLNHYFTKSCKSYLKKKQNIALGQTNFFDRTPISIIGPTVSLCFNLITDKHIMEKYVNKVNNTLKNDVNNILDYKIYSHILTNNNAKIDMKYLMNIKPTEETIKEFINYDLKYLEKIHFENSNTNNIDYCDL